MNFFVKQLIKRQLKGVPDEQIDMIVAAIEKDPAFFQRLAQEIEAKTKSGMSQQQAAQELMTQHGEELRKILGQ